MSWATSVQDCLILCIVSAHARCNTPLKYRPIWDLTCHANTTKTPTSKRPPIHHQKYRSNATATPAKYLANTTLRTCAIETDTPRGLHQYITDTPPRHHQITTGTPPIHHQDSWHAEATSSLTNKQQTHIQQQHDKTATGHKGSVHTWRLYTGPTWAQEGVTVRNINPTWLEFCNMSWDRANIAKVQHAQKKGRRLVWTPPKPLVKTPPLAPSRPPLAPSPPLAPLSPPSRPPLAPPPPTLSPSRPLPPPSRPPLAPSRPLSHPSRPLSPPSHPLSPPLHPLSPSRPLSPHVSPFRPPLAPSPPLLPLSPPLAPSCTLSPPCHPFLATSLLPVSPSPPLSPPLAPLSPPSRPLSPPLAPSRPPLPLSPLPALSPLLLWPPIHGLCLAPSRPPRVHRSLWLPCTFVWHAWHSVTSSLRLRVWRTWHRPFWWRAWAQFAAALTSTFLLWFTVTTDVTHCVVRLASSCPLVWAPLSPPLAPL